MVINGFRPNSTQEVSLGGEDFLKVTNKLFCLRGEDFVKVKNKLYRYCLHEPILMEKTHKIG